MDLQQIIQIANSQEIRNIINFCINSFKDINSANTRVKMIEKSLDLNEKIYTKASKQVAKHEKKSQIKSKVKTSSGLRLKRNIDFDVFYKKQKEIKKSFEEKPKEYAPILQKIVCEVS